MTTLKAIILGAVQGFAEFLPISSSGHLVIFNHLLASQGSSDLLFDVLVHLGTFLAVLVAFWRDVLRLLVECFSFLGDLFKGRLRGGHRMSQPGPGRASPYGAGALTGGLCPVRFLSNLEGGSSCQKSPSSPAARQPRRASPPRASIWASGATAPGATWP